MDFSPQRQEERVMQIHYNHNHIPSSSVHTDNSASAIVHENEQPRNHDQQEQQHEEEPSEEQERHQLSELEALEQEHQIYHELMQQGQQQHQPLLEQQQNQQQQQQEQEQQQCGTVPRSISLHVHPVLCEALVTVWDWTCVALDVGTGIFNIRPFPSVALQRWSIVLLGVERLRNQWWWASTIPASFQNGVVIVPGSLVWGIPAFSVLLSLSFVVTLQYTWNQDEAVVVTALISLIVVEALLPLFFLGCTSMLFFQQVTWELGLTILAIVWFGSTFCAHFLRRMLYQSLVRN